MATPAEGKTEAAVSRIVTAAEGAEVADCGTDVTEAGRAVAWILLLGEALEGEIVVMEPPAAVKLDRKMEASSGESVRVSGARVRVSGVGVGIDWRVTVTVTVTGAGVLMATEDEDEIWISDEVVDAVLLFSTGTPDP